ncbi:hypothetical protein LVJ94_02990 [Pendulispora rubella]|uniref:YD repeat-containing protein n=1 Tax=Pendulispora rubella TaxID=2741070 RepID=A0ABZ2L8S2_9BACT
MTRWIILAPLSAFMAGVACARAGAPTAPATTAPVHGLADTCRVRETFATEGLIDEHHFAADGRILVNVYEGSGRRGREDFSYDDKGRLVRQKSRQEEDEVRRPHPSPLDRAASTSEEIIVYAYDEQGRKTQATITSHDDAPGVAPSSTRSENRHYDDAGRLILIERTGGAYDGVSARFLYDGAHLVEERHEVKGRVVSSRKLSYEHGRLAKEEMTGENLGTARYAYTFDAAGRLTSKDLVGNGGPMPWQRLEYDGAGRIIRYTDRDLWTRYQYDAEGRIQRIEHSSTAPQTFEYDASCTAKNTALLLPNPIRWILESPDTLVAEIGRSRFH